MPLVVLPGAAADTASDVGRETQTVQSVQAEESVPRIAFGFGEAQRAHEVLRLAPTGSGNGQERSASVPATCGADRF